MNQNNLTAEQWQAIAEKLAEYLYDTCPKIPCDECGICDGSCVDKGIMPDALWIAKAKKELGYETVQEN